MPPKDPLARKVDCHIVTLVLKELLHYLNSHAHPVVSAPLKQYREPMQVCSSKVQRYMLVVGNVWHSNLLALLL